MQLECIKQHKMQHINEYKDSVQKEQVISVVVVLTYASPSGHSAVWSLYCVQYSSEL